ncbi:acyl-CoA N-acyltransferase [Mucidula mucida]|nr:acyl-CoA N-acyltransferase [Mucidula mucida]
MYQTTRLLIRPFEDSDTLDVHNLWTDPRVEPSRTSSTMELLQDKIHATHSLFFVVFELLDTGAFVGMSTLSIDGEWGIMLRKEFWGRGLGREVAEWTLRYALSELQMIEVNLRVLESNVRALHLYNSM